MLALQEGWEEGGAGGGGGDSCQELCSNASGLATATEDSIAAARIASSN